MRRLLIVGVAGFMLAACSSSTPTGSSSPDPSPTDTASGDSAEFLALAQSGFQSDTFKITFNATTGSDTSTITWARRGDEAAFTVGEGSDAFKIIEPGDGTTISCSGGSCFESADGQGGGGMADAFIAPFTAFSTFITEADDLPGFASTGSRTIAGRAATCASWSYFGATAEVCVDNATGLTLLWSAGAEGESLTWEVTEVGEPTDADFEPTGEVQRLPASG